MHMVIGLDHAALVGGMPTASPLCYAKPHANLPASAVYIRMLRDWELYALSASKALQLIQRKAHRQENGQSTLLDLVIHVWYKIASRIT